MLWALAAEPDWRSLLDRALTHDEENFARLRSYVFEVYDQSRASRFLGETQSYEINLVGPGMYFRKVKHNERDLSPEQASLEIERLRLHLAKASQSAGQEVWRKEREILAQWAAAHRFEWKGTRKLDGHTVVVIESKPPKTRDDSLAFLSAARCRLSLDPETGHWLEAVCEIERRTTFTLNQLLLGRISLPYSPGLINRGELLPGTTLTIRTQRLADGVWAPKLYRIEKPGVLSELSFSKFRKFTSESQLLTEPQ
ncbi:MAG: hypothetical protein FJW36_03025 [Acidobacteria bacterium]|nr:hypothetical protein [Acidobacteriota bacterium]